MSQHFLSSSSSLLLFFSFISSSLNPPFSLLLSTMRITIFSNSKAQKKGGKELYPMYYSFFKNLFIYNIHFQWYCSIYKKLLQHNSNIKRLRKQSFFFFDTLTDWRICTGKNNCVWEEHTLPLYWQEPLDNTCILWYLCIKILQAFRDPFCLFYHTSLLLLTFFPLTCFCPLAVCLCYPCGPLST